MPLFGDLDGSIVAVLFLFALNLFVTFGAKSSNSFNYVFTFAKLITLSVIVIVAFVFFNADNYSPFYAETTIDGVTYVGDFTGTLQGAGILFYAFAGFDNIGTLAKEIKDPK